MKNIIIFCIFWLGFQLYSQRIEKHQWQNRLLLVFANDKYKEILDKQIDILSKSKEGLIDRKLKIYQFFKGNYKLGFYSIGQQITMNTNKYLNGEESFKVVLIGLDGGVKLEQNSILSSQKLFAIIDGMPMRRRELKQKNE